MFSQHRPLPAFLRDAAIATVAFAVLLVPVVRDVGPEFVRYPGYLLYFPLMVMYIVAGGETEAPHGPSTFQVVAFVVALGLVTAGIAYLVRQRFDTSELGTWRFLAAGSIAVAGTLGSLFGLSALAGLVDATVFEAVGALVSGVALVGGGLLLVAGRE